VQQDIDRATLTGSTQHANERLITQCEPERVDEQQDGAIRVPVEQLVDDDL
jgi:hypothetical protein